MKKTLTILVTATVLTFSLAGCIPTNQVEAPGQEQIQKAKDVAEQVENSTPSLGG